nr:reverse transcriptase domain-containing protein [Tanacetum cinerariifolium]
MRDYAAYEQFVALCKQEAEGSRSTLKWTRTYIPRQQEEVKQRLIDDYFGDDETLPKYPKNNLGKARVDKNGVISLGFEVKSLIDVFSSSIKPLGGGLYLATKDGKELSDGCDTSTMPTATRFRMTQDVINELIVKRVEEALQAYDAAKNPGTKTELKNEQQDDNVKVNGNNGNGNGNGNGNLSVNNEGVIPVTRATVGYDASYAMTWKELIKLMTERFQELTLLCTKMVQEEEDQVKKYIGGLLDNIQGNVIVVEPIRLQDAIRLVNNLMDQKLKGYSIKNAENK